MLYCVLGCTVVSGYVFRQVSANPVRKCHPSLQFNCIITIINVLFINCGNFKANVTFHFNPSKRLALESKTGYLKILKIRLESNPKLLKQSKFLDLTHLLSFSRSFIFTLQVHSRSLFIERQLTYVLSFKTG